MPWIFSLNCLFYGYCGPRRIRKHEKSCQETKTSDAFPKNLAFSDESDVTQSVENCYKYNKCKLRGLKHGLGGDMRSD